MSSSGERMLRKMIRASMRRQLGHDAYGRLCRVLADLARDDENARPDPHVGGWDGR